MTSPLVPWRSRLSPLLVVVTVILAPLTAAAATATVTAVPERSQLAPGETFTVRLCSDDAATATSWGALLRFDPAVLRCTAQAPGDRGTFVADSRGLPAINADGEVRCGGFSMTATNAGSDIAVLTFEVIGRNTTTTLNVVAHGPDEPFGCVILSTGTVAVPDVVDALVEIGGGITRVVSLILRRGGVRVDVAVEVEPDHDSAEIIDGYSVFDELGAAVTYTFGFLLPANG